MSILVEKSSVNQLLLREEEARQLTVVWKITIECFVVVGREITILSFWVCCVVVLVYCYYLLNANELHDQNGRNVHRSPFHRFTLPVQKKKDLSA